MSTNAPKDPPQYSWRRGTEHRHKVDAQTAGERLEELRQMGNGNLTPKAVVNDARDETAVLHPEFEWHDPTAAELYRVDQARSLIRSVVIVNTTTGIDETLTGEPVRAFVSLSHEPKLVTEKFSDAGKPLEIVRRSRSYVSTEEALADPSQRAMIVQEAMQGLLAWVERYQSFADLADAVAHVKGLLPVDREFVNGRMVLPPAYRGVRPAPKVV